MAAFMTNVFWAFGGTSYSSYQDFETAVSLYQQQISPDTTQWNPSAVLAKGPIRVMYEAMWRNENDHLNIAIGEPGEDVTMGQILFALHNGSVDFFDGDHRFFEGISEMKPSVYQLWIGS